MSGINPIESAKEIKEKYIRYLTTAFKINDEDIQNQFIQELYKEAKVAKGPFLEISSSFVKGKSINELIEDRVLVDEFKNFRSEKFPFEDKDKNIYLHQEQAIKKAVQGRNVIVSTGTGSGKTESFLIPILNHLLKEKQEGNLTPGVRALILYPMNALANDQMKRLRELFKECPEITFGSFTGETKDSEREAKEKFRELNDGKDPLPNEILSRERMRENPPHILVTNYAMLEYLMLRPEDNVFFNGIYSKHWKYIVLDEAHTYAGAKGIEVAMLLRRLKDTIKKKGEIQYILTSASLGRGAEDRKEITEFGEKLSGEKFYSEDIVGATRIKHEEINGEEYFDFSIYGELNNCGDDKNNILTVIERYSVGKYIDSSRAADEILYDLILKDKNYYKFRSFLEEPMTLIEIKEKMKLKNMEQIVSFIEIAGKAFKNGEELFKSKYHYFFKSLEGGYLSLGPRKIFSLNRSQTLNVDGEDVKVFEISTCRYCNEIYIVGISKTDSEKGYKILEQKELYSEADEFSQDVEYYLLKNGVVEINEDEENEGNDENIEDYILCGKCGAIYNSASLDGKCGCSPEYMTPVIKVNPKRKNQPLHTCRSCSSKNTRGNVLKRFLIGAEGATAALGTALYEVLPDSKVITEEVEKEVLEDEFGFGDISNSAELKTKKQVKQYLVFSDSRQAAAYYATFMDESYNKLLRKRTIIEALSQFNEEISVKELINTVAGVFNKYEIFDESERRTEAWKSVLYEVFDIDRRYSLEGLGLLSFKTSFGIDKGTNDLSKEEVNSFLQLAMKLFREKGAIDYDHPLSLEDKEYFSYSTLKSYISLDNSDTKKNLTSWKAKLKNNARTDYLKKIAGYEKEKSNKFLELFWDKIIKSHLTNDYIDGVPGYQLGIDKLRIMPGKLFKWYYCSECNKLTPYNVKDMCPTYSCKGKLQEVDPEEKLSENHYRELALNLGLAPLKIHEHTAQLSSELAYEVQNKFVNQNLNVLSCSTTFEMGVDVGELETVFMRNMPPSPANYAQRSGRAGRRGSSSAFTLTFCAKKSHDFTFYRDPLKMIKGLIPPPKFDVENEKIIRRHIYAVCFGQFWKNNPETYGRGKVIELFSDENSDLFKKYLFSKPAEIKNSLENILPAAIQKQIDLENWRWMDQLFNGSDGDFTRVKEEYLGEIDLLEKSSMEIRNRIAKNENKKSDFSDIKRLTGMIDNLKNKGLIQYLSQKNLLPKYGFPVDTVELHSNNARDISLDRDLSVAISEYAPGAQVIANGKLITSRYVKTVPNMKWIRYRYGVCSCSTLNQEIYDGSENKTSICKSCGETVLLDKIYIIPGFGFRVDAKEQKAGTKKPKKVYSSDIFYVGSSQNSPTINQDRRLGKGVLTMQNFKNDELGVISKSVFFICEECGYGDSEIKKEHKNHMGYKCKGKLSRYNLGHNFKTDVAILKFDRYMEFQESISILYGLLEGISSYLDIERSDISGCLKKLEGRYVFVVYDTVPGGAGHVKRIFENDNIEGILKRTKEIISECECGVETSCYSCLRDYSNQKYHDILAREHVIKFIENYS